MNKIFMDAKDKNIAATLIYARGSDGKAYSDAEGTKQMTESELREAFLKGCLIHYGEDMYIEPFAFVGDSGTATLYFFTTAGDTATKSTLVSISDGTKLL